MRDEPLHQVFARGDAPDARLRWFCEPARWRVDAAAGGLCLEPEAGTDFWQRTHYGFEADNGHFLHLAAAGDFTLTTCVTSHPRHQYDQAGLMVRLSPTCWIKTSVEFEPEGPNRLGAVVTNNGYSDWSTQALASDVATVWLRVSMAGCDATVESSGDGRAWVQIRLARLLEREHAATVDCGLYACSPKAAGYRAVFASLDFVPAGAPA